MSINLNAYNVFNVCEFPIRYITLINIDHTLHSFFYRVIKHIDKSLLQSTSLYILLFPVTLCAWFEVSLQNYNLIPSLTSVSIYFKIFTKNTCVSSVRMLMTTNDY